MKYPSPSDNDFLKDDESGPCDPDDYLSICMKIMYAAIRTRPDILYQTSNLATRATCPTKKDMERLMNILKYLHGTKDISLIYRSNGNNVLSCYIDASFNCYPDARGHTGFVIFPDTIGSSGILYKSIKQKRVADSSAEAELMALHESVQYLIYMSNLFEEIGFEQRKISVFQDNKATIHMVSNEQVNYKGKSKFINRKLFGVYQYVEDGTIELVFVGTDKNVSDFLTKPLFGNKFFRFRVDILGNENDIVRGEEH